MCIFIAPYVDKRSLCRTDALCNESLRAETPSWRSSLHKDRLQPCSAQNLHFPRHTVPFQNIFFFFKDLPPITLLSSNVAFLLVLKAFKPHRPPPTHTHKVQIITLSYGNLVVPVPNTKGSTNNNPPQFLFLRYTTNANREQMKVDTR